MTKRGDKMTKITPGKFAVDDLVRSVDEREYFEYGYGRIVDIQVRKLGKPYRIKFATAKILLCYAEDEITK